MAALSPRVVLLVRSVSVNRLMLSITFNDVSWGLGFSGALGDKMPALLPN